MQKTFLSVLLFAVIVSAFPQNDSLTILTWNIYMRPRQVFWNQQVKRAKGIVEVLKNENIDVIVFQEAFDPKARRKLKKELSEMYPHQFGPGNRGMVRINSGIWVLSKYPLLQTKQMVYSDCGREDCIAKKSAMFSEIDFNGKKVHIIGTHLQAISGEKYDNIRANQMKMMAELGNEFFNESIPQIFTGDMNTATEDTAKYRNMLRILNAKDGMPQGNIQHSLRGQENDISRKPVNYGPKLIDFVFLKPNKSSAKVISREVMRYRYEMKKGRSDLSDHYAVKAVLFLE